MSDDEKKLQALIGIYSLRNKGYKFDKFYSMDDSYEELSLALHIAKEQVRKRELVDLLKKMFLIVLEFLDRKKV